MTRSFPLVRHSARYGASRFGFAVILGSIAFFGSVTASAQTLIYWRNSASTVAWGTNNNWSTTSNTGSGNGTAPGGVSTTVTAVFDVSTKASLTFTSPASAPDISGMTFNVGAPVYTFTLASTSLTLENGITNNSLNAPIFKVSGGELDIKNGSSANAALTLTSDGTVNFSGSATAGTSTISVSHATLNFLGSSTGGNALLTVTGASGIADFSGSAASNLGIGSLAGTGNVYVGGNTLSIGANNGSTTFTGTIGESQFSSGSFGGGINKVGTGTLTVNGNLSYTGSTTVSAGTLVLGSSSVTGTSSVVLAGGTLSFGALTAATLGSLGGASNLALTNGSSAAVDLTVGTNDQSSTYSGSLSGAGSLTKAGAGTFTLSGTNTQSGLTTITGGAIGFANGGALSPNSNVQLNGGVIALVAGGLTDFTLGPAGGQVQWLGTGGFGAVGSNQTFTLNGGAPLTWGSNYFVPDGTTLALGFSKGNATVTFANDLDLGASNRTVQVDHGTAPLDAVLSGAITGSGGLIKSGSGSLTLSGASNTYSGPTQIAAGALHLGATTGLPAGSNLQLNGGVLDLASDAATDFTIGTGGGQLTFQSGGGGFAAVGANHTVTLNGGAAIAWDTSLGSASTPLILGSVTADATLTFANDLNFGSSGSPHTIQVNNGAATIDAIVSGQLSGASSLIKTGDGILKLTNATNNYTGLTELQGGELEFSSLLNLGTTHAVVFNGGTLRFASGYNEDVSSHLIDSGAGVNIDTNGNDVTFANLSGVSTNALAKLGAGTLTITSATPATPSFALYQGPIVNGGTLILATSGSSNDPFVASDANSQAQFTIGGTGVTWTMGDMHIGAGANSQGSVTFTDSASITSNGLFGTKVGEVGTGSLSVLNHASFSTPFLSVGVGGTGTVLVDNASISLGTFLELGAGANGSITVQNGGSFTSASTINIGRGNPTNTAAFTVTGAGSQLTAATDLVVGDNSPGTLTIADGATVTSGVGTLGRASGVPGSVTITGAGSQWNINATSTALYLDDGSVTSVTLADGGALHFTGTNNLIQIGALSTFKLGTGGLASDLTATISNGGNFTINNTNSITLTGLFTDNGDGSALIKTGSGTAIIASGFGSSTGAPAPTAVTGGTLMIGNGGAVATSLGTLFVLSNSANLVLNTSTTSSAIGPTVISGAGSLTLSGTGAITLNGTSTYTGTTTISNGAAIVSNLTVISGASAFGNATSAIILGDATHTGAIQYAGSTATFTRGLTVNAGGGSLTNTGTGTLTVSTGGISAGGLFTTGSSTGPIVISSIISGAGGLTKTGTNNLTLSGASTYTGPTQIAGGNVTFNTLGNIGGAASSFGAPTDATGGLISLGSGTAAIIATYNGTGSTSNRPIDFTGTTGGVTLTANGTDALVLTGALSFDGAGTKVLTLSGTNTNANTLAGIVADNSGTNKTSLVKSAAGLWLLSGASTFTGTTTISAGTLSINSLTSVSGSASALGAPTTTANGTIAIGATTTAATLQYTGSGSSSNRVINLAGTTGGATLDASGTGALALSGGVTATGAGSKTLTLTGTSTDANSLGGVIVDNTSSNKTSLTKSGVGAWALSGANTFTGVTTISAGTLSINSLAAVSGGASALGAPTTATNGTIAIGAATTAATLQYTGSGSSSNRIINLAGTTGGATLDASGTGALALSGGVTATGAGSKTLTLTGTSTDANSLGGVIVDNTSTNKTSLTKSGVGAWALSGASTFTGVTTISAGTLSVASLAAGGTASNIGQSTNAAANLVLNGGTLSYTGAAQSTDRLFTLGTSGGTLDASGGGALNFTNAGSMGTTGTGARTLALTGTNTGANTLTAIIGDQSTNATSLTKSGAGAWTLAGVNTFTGGTTLSLGTLNVNSGATLAASTGTLTVTGGTLNFNNATPFVTSLSGTGGQINFVTGSTLTDTTSGTDTFGGVLGGAGGFTKGGLGSLLLTGINLYTGLTTVNAGALAVNGSLADTATTINFGATLGGSGTLGGATTIASGAHLAPGNLPAGAGSPGTLTFANSLTLVAGAILDFQLGTTSDRIRVLGGTLTGPSGTGALTLNISSASGFAAGTYSLFDFASAGTVTNFDATDFTLGTTIPGYDYSLAINGTTNVLELTATASAIPEPATFAAIFGALALGAAGLRRRRRQA